MFNKDDYTGSVFTDVDTVFDKMTTRFSGISGVGNEKRLKIVNENNEVIWSTVLLDNIFKYPDSFLVDRT